MSFAQIYNAKDINQDEIIAKARLYVEELRKRCTPQRVYLFGSLATREFKFGSDIDLLLVFKSIDDIRDARQSLRGGSRLVSGVPVDLLFMTEADFESKKDIGGVAFIAATEGVTF